MTARKLVLEASLVLLVGAGLAVSTGAAGAATPALSQASPPVGDSSNPICLSLHQPDQDLKIQVGNFSPPNSC